MYPTIHQIRETTIDRLAIQHAPYGFLFGLVGGLFFADHKYLKKILQHPWYRKIRSWKGLDFNKRVYLFGNPPAQPKPDEPVPVTDEELSKLSSLSLLNTELLNYCVPVTGIPPPISFKELIVFNLTNWTFDHSNQDYG